MKSKSIAVVVTLLAAITTSFFFVPRSTTVDASALYQASLEQRVATLEAQVAKLQAAVGITPEATATRRSVLPTATPRPAATATATTATSTQATANRNANLRAGPGTTYNQSGSASNGQVLTITGRNTDETWYQLNTGLWIAAFLVDNAPSSVPVVGAPSQSAPVQQVAPPTPMRAAPTAVLPTPTVYVPPTPVPAQVAPAAPCGCGGNYLNCSDFYYQSSAQACFEHCVVQGFGDIHRLDGDNDNVACESLP